jgi:DNA topoisomerase-1
MESAGIGRPSTYATILEKLYDKKYVVQGQNPQCDIEVDVCSWLNTDNSIKSDKKTIHVGGNEKDRLVPTPLGMKVDSYVQEVYPSLLDIDFTSRMELQLDHISDGSLGKNDALSQFYKEFHPAIEKQLEVMKEKSKEKNDTVGEPRVLDKELLSFPELNCSVVETSYTYIRIPCTLP